MQDLATGTNEDHFDAGDVIEERIENSMAKFKDYFDGKFDNLAKVMELEKQLEENKNKRCWGISHTLITIKAEAIPQGRQPSSLILMSLLYNVL